MAIPGQTSIQSTTQDPLHINIPSVQNHQSIRTSSPTPKTSTGIPNESSLYGPKFEAGLGEQERKPSLPAKLNLEGGHTQASSRSHPQTAPLRKNSGYKLTSRAYSPNPEDQSEEEDEEAGDETQSPPRKLETRSTMTLAPPKLPLLFFEEDSIGQIDFAYQASGSPPSTHSLADLTPGSEKTEPSSVKDKSDNSVEDNSGVDEPKPEESADPRPARDETETETSTERKPSPKPYTPPINTTFAKKNAQEHKAEPVQTSGKEDGDNSGSHGARGHSFYWHSPGSGSSSDEETTGDTKREKRQAKTTPPSEDEANNEEVVTRLQQNRPSEPLTIRPIQSTISSSLTSATALGFGGPSDWQHFTDYDAEEVDDLALYTSGKPKTAELPAGTPVMEEDENMEAALSSRRLMPVERDTLPTIQERASEILEDNTSAHDLQTKSSEHESKTDSRNSVHKSMADDSTRKSSIVEQEEARSSPKPGTQSSSDLLAPNDATNVSSTPPNTDDAKMVNHPFKLEKKTAIPSHMTHSRGLSNPSVQSSGLNSPVDSDDGRERIFISLQVPNSPGPDSNKAVEAPPPPSTTTDERPRERNLNVATNIDPKVVESPDMLRTGRMSVFPQSIEMEDPYGGLDPWAKASLNRYVKLLKEEAAAQTDEEKFTLFVTFMDRERRNRTALYDMDEDSENESTLQFDKIKDDKGKIRSRVSLKRKATPVIPSIDTMPGQPSQLAQPVRAETLPLERTIQSAERQDSQSSLNNLLNDDKNQQPLTAPPQQTSFAANGTAEESPSSLGNILEDKTTPRIGEVKEKGSGNLRDSTLFKDRTGKDKSSGKTGLSLSALKKKALDLGGRSIAKDRNTTPINLQTLLMKAGDDSKKTSIPSSVPRHTPPPQAVALPPQTAIAQPEAADAKDSKPAASAGDAAIDAAESSDKLDEAVPRQYEGDKAVNRQTIYRPFSGMLRQGSIMRGSNPGSKRSSVFDRKSLAAETSQSRSPVNVLDKSLQEYQKPRPQQPNYRFTILEPLLLVVPQEGVTHVETRELTHLRQNMEEVRDDFSFIHKTVLAWDSEAKKSRERNDKERHARTTQNEGRIDALFNDNEIGYGDISQLEAEFKRQEATRKAEEDRHEVSTFVSNVFDVVWARINYEIDQLQPLYDQCVELVDHASAGRTMFEDFEDAVPVAPAMDCLLILYQKLMVRYQKAFEAVLERDRRLKKVEIAPWYAMGSVEKVRKIEKKFEDAEKTAILEFCRQRDDRATSLMEVLDQNTLRGVGANQDYMESIMQAVRKICIAVETDPNKGISEDDVVSLDEVLKAKTITTHLARSSEQIVQTFHVADMLLNAADYEVSVANAKLSNADAAAFKRLREAKAKEDTKLTMDLEHRMCLIRGDTSRTLEEISKLLSLIPKSHNGDALAENNPNRQSTATPREDSQDRSSRVVPRGVDESVGGSSKNRRIPRKQ